MNFESTKVIELGSCAFRQWRADSHCRFIHGYRLISKIWFCCSELDNKNWVVDFGSLNDLKHIFEHQFDHTMCVAADDPMLQYFTSLHDAGCCDLRIMPTGVGIERTAEWCFNTADKFIREKTNNRCWVNKVEVWEHEKNSAIYEKKNACCKDKQTTSPSVEAVSTPTHEPVAAVDSVNTQGNEPKPAAFGNKVTTGWSNPFGGTSWGT